MAEATPKYQYSKPSLKGSITLNTEQAKFFGGNRFDNLMTSMFIVDVISRKLAQKLKTFDHEAVANAVGKKIEEVEKTIDAETQRLEAYLKAQKVAVRASYSSPMVRSFDITSPEIMRISKLLVAFDNLIMLMDTAWLAEKVGSAEAETYRTERTRQMLKLTRSLVGLGQSARNKAYASKVAEESEGANDLSEAKAAIELEEAKAEANKAERKSAGIEETDDIDLPDPLKALDDESAPQVEPAEKVA